MKKLLTIFFLFCFGYSFSQTIVPGSRPYNTVGNERGEFIKNLYTPRYPDTTAANVAGSNLSTNKIGIDSCGAIIFTYDVNGFWYRACSPKHWVRITSGGNITNIDSTINDVRIINDSTLVICHGNNVCDTIHFTSNITNLTNAEFITDSSVRVCSVDTINGGTVTICDTITVGPQPILYFFQNGVSQDQFRIVTFGDPTAAGGGFQGPGQIKHPTTLDIFNNKLTYQQATIYDYGFQVNKYPNFGFQNGSGLQAWMHENDGPHPNVVRLGVNYTDSIYETSPSTLPGYMGRTHVGYWIGVNATGRGSYGLGTDTSASKVSGIFFHTRDSSNHDGITFFAKHPPNVNFIAPISANGNPTLEPYRIMTLYDTGDVRLYHYPSIRNDGGSPKVLYTDLNGNIKLGPALTGSTVNIIDNTHIEICNANSCDTITVSTTVVASYVQVINDSTLLVCDTTFICDTIHIPGHSFDRGRYEPNQASFANTLHNTNGHSLEEINNGFLHFESNVGINGTLGEIQQTNILSTLSNIDTAGNGAYMQLNYANGFPYPQFQLSSSWLTNSTQITGNAQTLTFNQNAGQLFIPNLNRGVHNDSVMTINTTTNQVRYRDASSFGGSSITIINDTTFTICSFGTQLCDTFIVSGGVDSVRILNDSTLLVCAATCDTLHIPQTGFTNFTVDNGLSKNTPTNGQLGNAAAPGAPLLHETYINGTSAYSLNITGSKTGSAVVGILNVTNTSSGSASAAIYASNSFWAAIRADGTRDGVVATNTGGGGAISGTSNGLGTAIFGTSTNGLGSDIYITPASNNDVQIISRINRMVVGSAAGADGIGGSLDFYTASSTGSSVESNRLISKWTTANNATRTSQFIITGVNSSVTADLFTLSGSGALKLNKYGIGTFTGTPTYTLQVDASGNVIEGSVSGGGFVTADNGLTASTATNVQLGGTLIQNTTIIGNFTMLFHNSLSGQTTLSAKNDDASGTAISGDGGNVGVYGQSVNGNGVQGVSTDGVGVYAQGINNAFGLFATTANSATAVWGQATAGVGVVAANIPASTNTVSEVMEIKRASSGTAANGIGASVGFYVQSTTATQLSNEFISKWSDATNATRTSQLIITGINSAVTGNILVIAGDGSTQMPKYGAGAATFDASGNITSVSDIRLKDIQGEYTTGLDAVMNINPIIYKWNEKSKMETEHSYIGFSAQNIRSALGDNAIGINKDGYLSIQDRAILATLTNAIKQQQKEIEQLQIEVRKLKN